MNVLFVDIETSICELVGVELRELGYDVECLEFSSGALRAAQAGHVDVVILDVPASPDARRSAYKLADELRRDGIAERSWPSLPSRCSAAGPPWPKTAA
jgi:DNA-binding response OmpR family regulator